MNKLLFRLFIKNYADTKSFEVRESYGKLAGAVGIASNLLLSSIKFIVGVITGSIAIIADAMNSLGDAASSVITLVGFKLSEKPEDKEHPYGHARIEYLAGSLVSLIIIVVGVELGMTSFEKIINPTTVGFNWTVVAILVISMLIKLWQASFNMAAGRAIDSATLTATATDSRNDVIATGIVVLSLVISEFTELQLDGYLGLLVALFIIWSGFSQAKETVSPLLGEAPDSELVEAIEELAMCNESVLGIHDLVVHNYGVGKIFASLHIEVDSAVDIMVSHDMIDNIEKNISKQLHIHCVIHMDPINLSDPNREPLKEHLDRTVENTEGVLGIHDLRLVSGPTHTNVLFDIVVSHDCKCPKGEIIEHFSNSVKEYNSSFYTVATVESSFTE